MSQALQEIDRDHHHPGVAPEAWDLVANRTHQAADLISRSTAGGLAEPQQTGTGGSEVVRGHDNAGKPAQPYTRKKRGPPRPK